MPFAPTNPPARPVLAQQPRSPAGLWPAELLSEAFGWLLARPCPLCRQLPPAAKDRCCRGSRPGLCDACGQRLALPPGGLSGMAPLRWWSSGSYAAGLRQTLLNQRNRPDPAVIQALLEPLQSPLAEVIAQQRRPCRQGPGRQQTGREQADRQRPPLLVPVPSWKRRANPLPGLIANGLARGLGLRRLDLLARSHPVLGQHRLGRRLRQENQRGSFQLRACHGWRPPHSVLLVDDILTTGATLRHAALCLEQAGWRVVGAACLARTPDRRDWLRTP